MQILSKKPITEEETKLITDRLKELHAKGYTKRSAKRKVGSEFSIKFKQPEKKKKLPENCHTELSGKDFEGLMSCGNNNK